MTDSLLGSKNRNPFGDLIGLTFSRCEGGVSRCSVGIGETLLNPHGVVHGGVLFAMADTGMGAALYSALDENQSCATIEVTIVYLRPVASGTLTCESRLLSKGARVAALESELWAEGHLVSKALGTFSILGPATGAREIS